MSLSNLRSPLVPRVALIADVVPDGETTVVAVRGEADQFTLPVVVSGLSRAIADGEGAVVVDLADATFVDAATVRAIARAAMVLHERKRMLTVRSPSPAVGRIHVALGLSHLLEADRPDRNAVEAVHARRRARLLPFRSL